MLNFTISTFLCLDTSQYRAWSHHVTCVNITVRVVTRTELCFPHRQSLSNSGFKGCKHKAKDILALSPHLDNQLQHEHNSSYSTYILHITRGSKQIAHVCLLSHCCSCCYCNNQPLTLIHPHAGLIVCQY